MTAEPPEVYKPSSRAWVELLHAEVGFLLRENGIPVLHIKGPTVARWLYAEGERPWGDVDILVPPSLMHEALQVLYAHGFVDRYPGVNRTTSTDHAIAVRRMDPAMGLDEVDVHDRFEGIDGDPERGFEVLWAHREPDTLAHVDVWFPDLTSRALLVCLNAARSSQSRKALEDLRRLVASDVAWDLVVALAGRVGAQPAMRAGLELDDAGRALVSVIGLDAVDVSPEWQLRVVGASRTTLRLEELHRLPWSRRAPAIARWLLPSPALVRMRDPDLAPGLGALAAGYLRRLGQGIRALPSAVRAVRATRQR